MTSPGSFTARVKSKLLEIHAEQAELAELEESWARGLASHLAELLFSIQHEERVRLGFGYALVTASPESRWGEGRFAYASTGSLREGGDGGWVYERIAIDERGGIRIVTTAPGQDDPAQWDNIREWPAEGDAFGPEEVFGCLQQIMSGIVARVEDLRKEVEDRRASLDELPGLVKEFGAVCGMARAQTAETSGTDSP